MAWSIGGRGRLLLDSRDGRFDPSNGFFNPRGAVLDGRRGLARGDRTLLGSLIQLIAGNRRSRRHKDRLLGACDRFFSERRLLCSRNDAGLPNRRLSNLLLCVSKIETERERFRCCIVRRRCSDFNGRDGFVRRRKSINRSRHEKLKAERRFFVDRLPGRDRRGLSVHRHGTGRIGSASIAFVSGDEPAVASRAHLRADVRSVA